MSDLTKYARTRAAHDLSLRKASRKDTKISRSALSSGRPVRERD